MSFPANLEHVYARDFKEKLRESADLADSTITLDLGEVERSGLACIQVLLAFKESFAKQEQNVELIMSESLKSIISDLGLSENFNI